MKKNFIGEKEKWTNKMNDKHEDADSLLHDITSHSQCLFKILHAVVPAKCLKKNFIGEKEKMDNKGIDENEDAGSLLHNTTSHSQCLLQISKS